MLDRQRPEPAAPARRAPGRGIIGDRRFERDPALVPADQLVGRHERAPDPCPRAPDHLRHRDGDQALPTPSARRMHATPAFPQAAFCPIPMPAGLLVLALLTRRAQPPLRGAHAGGHHAQELERDLGHLAGAAPSGCRHRARAGARVRARPRWRCAARHRGSPSRRNSCRPASSRAAAGSLRDSRARPPRCPRAAGRAHRPDRPRARSPRPAGTWRRARGAAPRRAGRDSGSRTAGRA